MSAGEEATEPSIMVTAQMTISMGFDEDGDPAVWVEAGSVSSIVEALGMLEFAKTFMIARHEQE